jgi:type IV secretory pathway VirB10-like protein
MKYIIKRNAIAGFVIAMIVVFIAIPHVSVSTEPQETQPPQRLQQERLQDPESQEVPSLSLPFTFDPKQATAPSPAVPTPAMPPHAAPAPAPNSDMQADPLFLEIQKMILNGGKSKPHSKSDNVAPESLGPELQVEDISSHRWNAVESMLHAARLLELDAAAQLEDGDMEQAANAKAMSKQLRRQCLDLLGR